MNRRQFLFVVICNALLTLLLTSSLLVVYEWRRFQPYAAEWGVTTTPGALSMAVTAIPVAEETPVATPVAAVMIQDTVEQPERTYTVREGDSLSAIAALFGISQRALATANGITNPNLVTVGQTLVVPGGNTAAVSMYQQPTAEDFGLEVLNAGTYAEEVIVIVNLGPHVIDLSGWSIHTSLDEQYTFVQMLPLYQDESVRLLSGAGTDTAYDKHWSRLPVQWGSGTIIALRDPTGATILRFELP